MRKDEQKKQFEKMTAEEKKWYDDAAERAEEEMRRMKLDRHYVDDTPDNLNDIIDSGVDFYFEYKERDYLIERSGNNSSYIIVDPQFLNKELRGKHESEYPGHEEAKTPEEMKLLPFLNGKTIFERFDELRFFD